MTRDKDINSDDQVAPDRVGSSAAEGGASAGGGFGVGLGVVDSRLPPHTKPPTHHTNATTGQCSLYQMSCECIYMQQSIMQKYKMLHTRMQLAESMQMF